MGRVKREAIYERVIVGWRVTCQQCSTVFEAKLKRATYCSDACRLAAFKEKRSKR